MIRSIIVDDESSARRTLRNILREYFPEVEVVGEATYPVEAIEAIGLHRPDLVFLDIEMQEGTGFDVLENVGNADFQVIFITAYDQYAVKCFRYAAVDYLLKPVRISELRESIARVQERLRKPLSGADWAVLRDHLHSPDLHRKTIILPELTGFSVVSLGEIIRCEAAKNYTVFYLETARPATVSRPLGEYEELLEEEDFLRIHKSHIVNLAKVRRYIRGRGGDVEMSDGTLLPVSREKKQDLIDFFSR